ncbi:ATP-dependent helicase [Calidifontibacter sp. DB0510]|uniref:DNA 3'-5' helicase n=1 Tax=Metallococcus carri TaxID=1656884 RepID=A0A967B6I3_9MICO|nr:ATP-dependent DNA helicase [Metallococcus carri]NHN56487.1 ATP-dependent helicase [Metallococcus carri]NOP36111.1 ATP-dependent helicase [Calidifontibacter sp. DB2511S]
MPYSATEIAQALGLFPPTEEQRAVIEQPLGPLLVVAGAGSGKTETMAGRVVWLVANGFVQPDEVLGLTFTRKAAGQLAERIGSRLRRLEQRGLWSPQPAPDGTPGLADIPTVQTYHSYAGRLVREHGLRAGVEPDARLLTEAAAWQYASEVVHRYDGPMGEVDKSDRTVTAAVVGLAGEMAEHLLASDEVDRYLTSVIAELQSQPPSGRSKALKAGAKEAVAVLSARRQILPIVQRYQALKRERSALDFADQMAVAARVAQRFPVVGAMERRRFRAVLLDEFQDTSEAQMVLLRSLFVADGEAVPVTAVGDPNQSIYGWRGASATTLAAFPGNFREGDRETPVLQLSTSWRNASSVLDAANTVSEPLRRDSAVEVAVLRPRPDAPAGRVELARLTTVDDEAALIADWLRQRRRPDADGVLPTAAVLCRKRSLFAPMAEALRRAGLPVEVVGIGGLLLTPEVSDLVSLLWVVQDPTRGDRLMRLLTGPMVRLGAADLDALAAWSRHLLDEAHRRIPREQRDIAPDSKERAAIAEALDQLPPAGWTGPRGERLSDLGARRLAALAAIVQRLRSMPGLPLAELAGEAERALGLDIEVLARPEHTPETARVHLDAFADVASHFSASADRPTLGGFLEWLDAAEEEERGLDAPELEASHDAVQILTVHAAKGLEWDHVAVPGLVEGTFPDHATNAAWDDELAAWTLTKAADHRDWRVLGKGWLIGVEGVPYELRGDRAGLPEFRWAEATDVVHGQELYEQFRAEVGEHLMREERRLAYVALTRARSDLLLTSSAWLTGATPRLPARFLLELREAGAGTELAWEEMPEPGVDGKAVNPREAEPVTTSWPHDPLADRRSQLAAAYDRVRASVADDTVPVQTEAGAFGARVAELHQLLRERAERRRTRVAAVLLPQHLSASGVVALARDPERFARELRRPMPSPPALAARQGTQFHAWVEQYYASAALVDIGELPGSGDDDADPQADLETMKAAFLASEWAGRTPSEIELALETWIGGLAVRGRIDAVFPRPDGGFTIVDWKTGKPPSGAAARARDLQLAAYRVAFARLHGLAPDRVDAAFFYAQTGETVRPELPEEQELEQLLAALTG